jgi:hypothetical protein
MAGRSGTSVLLKFFGKIDPTQTLQAFADETHDLSDRDFEQLKSGIESGTFTY